MKSVFTSPFELIVVNASLIFRATMDDIKKRNIGTLFGTWWLVLSPALLLGIYSIVYLVIFKIRPLHMSKEMYLLHIFGGLLPFLYHSEAISLGMNSIKSNKSLLKSTSFPSEIIPIKSVLSAAPSLVIGLIFIIIGAVILGQSSVYLLGLFLVVFLQTLFLIGACWLLSLSSLILRDLQNLIVYLNMMLMVISPIAYTVEMVPENLRFVVWLNPISYFVISNQHFIQGQMPPTKILLTMIAFSFLFFGLGYHFFNNFKRSILSYV
jgi:lipopolysaccharide transport system permease protein